MAVPAAARLTTCRTSQRDCTPRCLARRKMRPTLEVDTVHPSRRSGTTSLSLPQLRYWRRSSSTAFISSGLAVGRRTRLGRREQACRRLEGLPADPEVAASQRDVMTVAGPAHNPLQPSLRVERKLARAPCQALGPRAGSDIRYA